jgi:hypothetical protein
MHMNNRKPRRQWEADRHRAHVACVACGAPARRHATDLPFCETCLDWARDTNLAESDESSVSD